MRTPKPKKKKKEFLWLAQITKKKQQNKHAPKQHATTQQKHQETRRLKALLVHCLRVALCLRGFAAFPVLRHPAEPNVSQAICFGRSLQRSRLREAEMMWGEGCRTCSCRQQPRADTPG